MFRRHVHVSKYLAILAMLLMLLSIPAGPVEKIRGGVIALISPFLSTAIYAESQTTHFIGVSAPSDDTDEKIDLQQVEVENQLLKNEIRKLKQLFEHELQIIAQLSTIISNSNNDLYHHQNELLSIVNQQIISLPAQVIFRSPASWGSSFWVNVGERDNENLDQPLIAKNSPVVFGKSVIGVVDYVGGSQSRIRLITDSGLTPSVRVSRGSQQNQQIKEHIQVLQGFLATQNNLFETSAEKSAAIEQLETLKQKIVKDDEHHFLAKGELQGSSSPAWRAHGQTLKGIGFNYDYSDAEGPARDLRSGIPINAPDTIPAIPIIQEGDTLVTTGYDGVFPPGLSVATVTNIHLLKEGDYYYELEAEPTAGNFNELETVYILPPVGFNISEKPY